MKLNDIEITRFCSYASQTLLQDQTNLRERFTDILETSITYLSDGKSDGFANTEEGKIEKKIGKEGHFVRILKSKGKTDSYVKFDDFERKLAAGIYLDAYLLKESVYKKVKPGTDANKLIGIANQLKDLLPKHNQESKLPADCFCYFVESEQPEADKNEIFEKLLNSIFVEVDLEHSYFAANLQGEQAVAVIIPKDAVKTQKHTLATRLYGEVLQEYFLSYAKVANETASIKSLKAKETRTILINFLDWLEIDPPKTLSQIEYANHNLSTYRSKLADKIITIETHIHTIEINIRNADDVLNHNLWKHKKNELNEILIKPLQHKIEQAKADLAYLKLYDDKAKIQGEEIANLSNLQVSIYGRKLAWFFGLLTLIGAFQLFKGFTDWDDTTAKILILGAIIIIPCWILFVNDIKDYIYGINEFKSPSSETTQTEVKTDTKSAVSNHPITELPPSPAQVEITTAKRAARKQRR